MATFWLLLVHWLHVLGGILWFGGAAFAAFVLWPSLLRQPAPVARAQFQAMARPLGALMGGAAQLTFWMGLLRGTWLGPVRSFDALLGTAYGRTFGIAVLLMVVLMGYGIAAGRTYERRIWDGDAFRPDAAAYLKRTNAVILTLFAVILLCMVLMRFGL